MYFDSRAIGAMDSRPRAAFVNSLSGFKSANLVGTASVDGSTNLAIVSSAVHLGSHPPLLAIVLRPGDERDTLRNLLSSGCYTLNHVAWAMVDAAHQTAARYGPGESEFEATGLSAQWRDGFAAPFVAGAPLQIGLVLREHQRLAINGTHLVIGEVVHVEVPARCIRDDGSVDLIASGSVAVSGLDTYVQPGRYRRMAYAKPHLPPRPLDAQPASRPETLTTTGERP